MKLSEQIIRLRKQRGLSHEELAVQIGVSRQAVSKWESEQSVPDLEKIIRLSDFFGITIDELIKGEPPDGGTGGRPDAKLFVWIATAFHALGLVSAWLTWYEWQNALSVLLGLVLMVIGSTIFGIGMSVAEPHTRERAKKLFWQINIWLLVFLPLALTMQLLFEFPFAVWSPYVQLYDGGREFLAFCVLYLLICGIVEFILHSRGEDGEESEKSEQTTKNSGANR